jgi:hypothetical protein
LVNYLTTLSNGRTGIFKIGEHVFTSDVDRGKDDIMQLFPEQLALINLRGEVHPSEREYMTREEAFEMLRETAEVDFGEDVEKWEEWVKDKYADVPTKEDCDGTRADL